MEANNLIKKEFILGGLNCAHCAEEINNKVSKLRQMCIRDRCRGD